MEHKMNPLPVLQGAPLAKDPVCGMNVNPAKAAGAAERHGKKYYFCSAGCAQRFVADPERYVAAPGAAGREYHPQPATSHQPTAPSSEQKKIRYTCPMHPEVIQWGPGSCPKCGMALEPMDFVATGADEAPDPEYGSMRNRFWVSAALSLPVLLLAMFGEEFGLPLSTIELHWVELVLATPVVLWGGWPFFERFWSS